MVDQRRRYAIVGTGSRARMYVGALTDTHADVGELVALCDPNPARMDYYRDELGLGRRADLRARGPGPAVRRDPTRTALIVTSPDATHDIYICAALERGLDVVTEKPMTIDDGSAAAGSWTAVRRIRRRPDRHVQLPLLAAQLRGPAS